MRVHPHASKKVVRRIPRCTHRLQQTKCCLLFTTFLFFFYACVFSLWDRIVQTRQTTTLLCPTHKTYTGARQIKRSKNQTTLVQPMVMPWYMSEYQQKSIQMYTHVISDVNKAFNLNLNLFLEKSGCWGNCLTTQWRCQALAPSLQVRKGVRRLHRTYTTNLFMFCITIVL